APKMSPHEIAASWFLRGENGASGAADRARLEAWLADDPRHQAAWDDVSAALQTVADNAADEELLAMRSLALQARPDHRGPMFGVAVAAALLLV
ncbi:FecR/PupR family sigma factor regulator, partial [Escherichia coli]|uniref:FecR/PupR family sigma factor regulator n=4 Tax=Pseudomonadota TaxID=1224 RepID=UPI0015C46FB6